LIFTVAVVFADMAITGIKAAKKERQKISSKGLVSHNGKDSSIFCSGILIFEGARNTFSASRSTLPTWRPI
jgi:hypothetical protein